MAARASTSTSWMTPPSVESASAHVTASWRCFDSSAPLTFWASASAVRFVAWTKRAEARDRALANLRGRRSASTRRATSVSGCFFGEGFLACACAATVAAASAPASSRIGAPSHRSKASPCCKTASPHARKAPGASLRCCCCEGCREPLASSSSILRKAAFSAAFWAFQASSRRRRLMACWTAECAATRAALTTLRALDSRSAAVSKRAAGSTTMVWAEGDFKASSHLRCVETGVELGGPLARSTACSAVRDSTSAFPPNRGSWFRSSSHCG
mmetsp:Transcript_2508/g.7444  ORF Transcript_2508/g.7444 Transcript_2508/m.7444 type:complete len:272 (-) Transcript_2508:672-1487(-)